MVLCTIDTLHNKAMIELRSESGGRLHAIYIDEASLVSEEAIPIVGLFNAVSAPLSKLSLCAYIRFSDTRVRVCVCACACVCVCVCVCFLS